MSGQATRLPFCAMSADTGQKRIGQSGRGTFAGRWGSIRQMASIGIAVAMFTFASEPILGETVFFDDFNDGSVLDGSPVAWTPDGAGFIDASSGDFVLGTATDFIAAQAHDFTLSNTSIRVRGHVSDESGLFVTARNQNTLDVPLEKQFDYRAEINARAVEGDAKLWDISLGKRGQFGNAVTGLGIGTVVSLEAGDDQDIFLQLDVIGSQLKLWAWPASGQMSSTPQLQWEDNSYSSGSVGVAGWSLNNREGETTFRFIHVADDHIPFSDGDFDMDGRFTASDIDRIVPGANDPRVDLNGNGIVEILDRQIWINDLAGTWFGDVNLDGAFDSGDLVAAVSGGIYEDAIDGNATWITGDWDGDGDFTSSDLTVALVNGGYNLTSATATAVPEPSGWIMLATAALMRIRRFRRR